MIVYYIMRVDVAAQKKGWLNMFDIAYTPEATICAAEIEIKKLWKICNGRDYTKPFSCFCEFMEIDRCERALKYWSIWFGTHGV